MDSHLCADRPIAAENEDALGRLGFINTLYREIHDIDPSESIVIGLAGSWGSGKTSVVNLICRKLESERNGRSLKPGDTIIVRFNPWNQISAEHDSEKYFINSFFGAIRKQLWADKDDWYINPDNLQELFEAVDEYIALLEPGIIKTSVSLSTHFFKKRLHRQMDTIFSAKHRVKETLGDFDIKILVVIDDIDRLPKAQIRLLFQLITTIADFESVNYLIAYDKRVAEKALDDVQGLSGSDYLEKVIQVPINMPNISSASMNAAINKRLSFIPNNYYTKREAIEDASSRFSRLLPLLQKTIRTVRQLNRLENSLRFKLPLMTTKVDAIDLLAIEHLRIISEETLEWIASHADTLCVDNKPNAIIRSIDQAVWNDLTSSYLSLNKANAGSASLFEIIEFLFHWPRQVFAANGYKSHDAHVEQRIIDFTTLEYYLTTDSDASIYSTDDLQLAVNTMDAPKLAHYVNQFIRENGYLESIESLAALEKPIDASKATNVIEALAKNIKYADRTDMAFSENIRTIDVIELFLSKLGKSHRNAYVLDLFGSLDNVSIILLGEFIIRQDRVYKRHGFEGESSYTKIISEHCVERLEELFSQAMSALAISDELEDIPDLYPQMILWRNVDNSGYRKILSGVAQKPIRIALFSESFVGSWKEVGTGEVTSYRISQEILDYATQDELLAAVAFMNIPIIISFLPQNTQQKTAALFIALHRDKFTGDIGEEIHIDEVNEQLNIWFEDLNRLDEPDSDEDGESTSEA